MILINKKLLLELSYKERDTITGRLDDDYTWELFDMTHESWNDYYYFFENNSHFGKSFGISVPNKPKHPRLLARIIYDGVMSGTIRKDNVYHPN